MASVPSVPKEITAFDRLTWQKVLVLFFDLISYHVVTGNINHLLVSLHEDVDFLVQTEKVPKAIVIFLSYLGMIETPDDIFRSDILIS